MESNNFFPNTFNINEYIKEYSFEKILNFKATKENKIKTENYVTNKDNCVDPDWEKHNPLPPQFEDLARLHHLVLSRKVITVLEFGLGRSTVILADALRHNKKLHSEYVTKNIRRKNLFECHSVENNVNWIDECNKFFPIDLKNEGYINIHETNLSTSTFNERICTFYGSLPNICPDLIYLDGPDQFSPAGDIRGISTKHSDRMPMAADILSFEHFLLPGTLIVVDGRGANARFLKVNLQRNWMYHYSEEWDQHFFELKEQPLGSINKKLLDFTLGKNFYHN